jgi:5-methylcytosine-specific restriction endonuclease McrA
MTRQLRNCFLPPIPELDEALDLLSKSADALLEENYEQARKMIKMADIRSIWDFTFKIIGPINPEIHHQKHKPAATLPAHQIKVGMPGNALQRNLHQRDGWRCRYCGCRVVSKEARKVLIDFFPSEARWGKSNLKKHWALGTLSACIDHVMPRSHGGTNDESNLVTACTPCNFGKWNWTLEEINFSDPRDRSPQIDTWDGLMRIVIPKLKKPKGAT